MTVQIDTAGPGNEAYRSAKFEAAIGASVPFVYSWERTTEFDVPDFWDASDTVEVSMFTFGCDVATDVVVTLADDSPITTVRLFANTGDWDAYPEDEITHSIVAGALTITMPLRCKLRVEVNGDKANVLFIHSDGLKPAIPGGYITYNGTQTSVGAGACLYFPAGAVHTLPAQDAQPVTGANPPLFPIGAGATVYIEHGAIVVGSFNTTAVDDWTITGPGIVSGEWATNEDLEVLTAAQRNRCALVWNDTGHNHDGCTISGVTFVIAPDFTFSGGVNTFQDVKVYSPWTNNTDGIKAIGGDDNGYTIEHCSVWAGDDAIGLEHWRRNGTVSRNLICTSGSSMFLLGYEAYDDFGWSNTISDNTVRLCCDYYSIGDAEGGDIVKGWADSARANKTYAIRRNAFSNLRILGAENNTCFCSLGPRLDPWGGAQDNVGSVYGITFTNVFAETAFAEPIKILSHGAASTVHSVSFTNCTFGGVPMSMRRIGDFIEFTDSPAAAASRVVSDYAYNITIDGVTMTTTVDICNLALSHIGAAAKVTSILGDDTSAEARHCIRFYPMARDTVLALHDWSFARTRAALVSVTIDNDAWDYAYTIPSDMLKAIAVMHEDATDDYAQALSLPDGTTATVMGASNQVIPQTFVIEQNTSDVLVIMTDQEDAWLRYTKYVTDTALFPPLFIQAVSYMLAAQLAGVLLKGKEGAEEHRKCTQLAMAYLSQARVIDSMQRKVDVRRSPSWIAAR